MDALLAGATGLIGREIARQWRSEARGTLVQLVRRAGAGEAGATLREQVVDFARLPPLPPAGAAFCALGTTIRVAGSQAAFRAVDLDAVLALARAARAAGVARFGVVSALGADARSGTFYNRVKGEMEQALQGVGFERLVIARPSLLVGDRAALGQAARPGEALALTLTAPLARLIPKAWRPIPASRVARALLRGVLGEGPPRGAQVGAQAGAHTGAQSGVWILESAALQDLGLADTDG